MVRLYEEGKKEGYYLDIYEDHENFYQEKEICHRSFGEDRYKVVYCDLHSEWSDADVYNDQIEYIECDFRAFATSDGGYSDYTYKAGWTAVEFREACTFFADSYETSPV